MSSIVRTRKCRAALKPKCRYMGTINTMSDHSFIVNVQADFLMGAFRE